MPASSSGTSPCGGGTYGGFAIFTNGGIGFSPDAGTTSCTANVQAGGTAVPNTYFDLQWRVTMTDKGCAANSGTNDKTFNSSPSKKYNFTVYFKTGRVPAQGTDITLTLNFS